MACMMCLDVRTVGSETVPRGSRHPRPEGLPAPPSQLPPKVPQVLYKNKGHKARMQLIEVNCGGAGMNQAISSCEVLEASTNTARSGRVG